MKSYRALQTIGKTTDLIDTSAPDVSVDSLIVEPVFVGVCGTDLQIIRRQRPDPATILGHEGVARIIENSRNKDEFPVGSYITFNPVDPTDQNQILGHNTPGLLQERYEVTPHAQKNNLVVPFPANVKLSLGALVEPLGTVIYGHELVSKVIKQGSIVIVGAGAIGIMHALYAKSQGYKKVFLINASRPHLDWCVQREIVAPENALLDSDNLPEKIFALTKGNGIDAVYMCTSRPNALLALTRAIHYVKDGGCIDIVGGIKDGDRIPELPAENDLNEIRRANFCGIPAQGYIKATKNKDGKNLKLTGHRGTSRQHLVKAIYNLGEHGELFYKVVSHIISPQAAVDLFNEVAKGSVNNFNGALYIKAIVDMRLTGKVVKNV